MLFYVCDTKCYKAKAAEENNHFIRELNANLVKHVYRGGVVGIYPPPQNLTEKFF